jgi:hypothetical protein
VNQAQALARVNGGRRWTYPNAVIIVDNKVARLEHGQLAPFEEDFRLSDAEAAIRVLGARRQQQLKQGVQAMRALLLDGGDELVLAVFVAVRDVCAFQCVAQLHRGHVLRLDARKESLRCHVTAARHTRLKDSHRPKSLGDRGAGQPVRVGGARDAHRLEHARTAQLLGDELSVEFVRH